MRHGSLPSRFVLPVIRFVGTHVLTVRTPMGRKARPRFLTMAPPLIRLKSKDLDPAAHDRMLRAVESLTRRAAGLV